MTHTIGIFYFSGTGNTRLVAHLFEEELERRDVEVDVLAIEDILQENRVPDVEKYDMIGIGYTVHALNAPRIVFDFLNRLPAVTQKNVFLFKCPGDPLMQGGSTSMLRNRLQSRGYAVFHESLLVMPANVFISFHERLVKQLYEAARCHTKTIVGDILAGKIRLQKNSPFLRALTRISSSLESVGVRLLGRTFRVSSACSHCLRCVELCPTKNISHGQHGIRFHGNCLMCVRCVYACPQSAISPGFFRFFVFKNGYNIQPIIEDSSLSGDYLSEHTTGFFKHYYQDYLKKT